MATATAVRTKPEQFGGLLGKKRVGFGANAERAAALAALPALVEAVKTYAEAYHAAWQALTQKQDAEAVQESIPIPAPSRKLEAVMDGTLNPEKLPLDERKDLFKEASAITATSQDLFQNTILLLHRDGLRQVARLVDVFAHENGRVIGEQLHRHGVDDRRDRSDARSASTMVAMRVEPAPPRPRARR